MAVRTIANARPLAKFAGAGIGVVLLSACAATGGKGDIIGYGEGADYKDVVGVYTNPEADPSGQDPIAAAAYWGTQYQRNPNDPATAVRYSGALRKLGSIDEAVSVMTKTAQSHPDNADVNLETGKTLVEGGRSFEAIRYLQAAATDKPGDWRALSAYGVALDQIGEHEEARRKYDEALRLAPGAVSVVSNKGLSFALSGDLDRAATTLRSATAHRRADARIRQNLALVLALKGDMTEATRLARSDLPPQTADNNIAYFRTLMAQPAYWANYAPDSIEVPDFDPAPAEPAPAAPLPRLKETPKREEKSSSPVALAPAVSVTPAAEVVETPEEEPADSPREIENAPELKQN